MQVCKVLSLTLLSNSVCLKPSPLEVNGILVKFTGIYSAANDVIVTMVTAIKLVCIGLPWFFSIPLC